MIPKIHRLKESDVKKLLRQRSTVFGTSFVVNIGRNRWGKTRYGIIFSAKHTRGSVNRNYFRRLYYTHASLYLGQSYPLDILFVPRKGTLFQKTDIEAVKRQSREIQTLLHNIFTRPESYLTPHNRHPQRSISSLPRR